MNYKESGNNIEEEILYENNQEPEITDPFNPKDVDIISQPMVVGNVIERLEYDAIVLDPDFQRNKGLWTDVQQSRLIESLIIRIPLPSFYFDSVEDSNETLIVVDGLQRLWALKRFAVLKIDDPQKLRLCGLEYLTEYEGFTYEELPVTIRRRIREQTLNAYVIRPGTPDNVRSSIFTRINTGGVHLLPAEIKNSVYRGQAADLLRELAHSKEFIQATRNKIEPERMLDCEFVNRFFAFYLLEINEYKGNLDSYLNCALEKIKNTDPSCLTAWKHAFLQSMKLSVELFGEKAFRKRYKNGKYGKINKPLFECVSVVFARLTEENRRRLADKKSDFRLAYEKLLQDTEFVESITDGTASLNRVKIRYQKLEELVEGIIGHDPLYSN